MLGEVGFVERTGQSAGRLGVGYACHAGQVITSPEISMRRPTFLSRKMLFACGEGFDSEVLMLSRHEKKNQRQGQEGRGQRGPGAHI